MKKYGCLYFSVKAGWVCLVLFACTSSPASPPPTVSPIPPTATPRAGPFAEIYDELQLACERAGGTPSVFGPIQLPVAALTKPADQESEWAYQPLGDTGGVVASDVASLRTIACIQQEIVLSTGYVYSDGSKPYDNLWRVKFVSWPDGKLLSNTEVRFVGYAPGTKPVGGPGIGEPPVEKLIEFLQDASRARLTFVGEGMSEVSFSADGSLLAVAYGNGQVLLWELISGRILNQFSTLQQASWIALSPDGSKLAFEADGSLGTTQVFETSSGKLLFSLDGSKAIFSPDGRYLAVANPEPPDGNDEDEPAPIIMLVDAETGASLGGLELDSGHFVFAMAFTQDGKWLIENGGKMVYPQPMNPKIEGTLNVWDTAQHTLTYTLDDPITTSAWIEKIAASPNEPLAAFFSFTNGLHLWNFETGEIVQSVSNSTIFYGQAFSPDGRFLALNTDDPGELAGCCTYLLDLSDYGNKIRLPQYDGLSNLAFGTLAFDRDANSIHLVSAEGIMVTMDYAP